MLNNDTLKTMQTRLKSLIQRRADWQGQTRFVIQIGGIGCYLGKKTGLDGRPTVGGVFGVESAITYSFREACHVRPQLKNADGTPSDSGKVVRLDDALRDEIAGLADTIEKMAAYIAEHGEKE